MACSISPNDKKKFLSAVGKDLVSHHGKKKYYTQDQIHTSCKRLAYDIDWICWAYCIFTDPITFAAIHEASGEVCDYTKMKTEALFALADGTFQLPDIDLSWLEWPDIDLSSVFDWFDIG
ncbi:MAG: hypothetical protein AAGA18_08525 [Verrucomicrobiota bacterium]